MSVDSLSEFQRLVKPFLRDWKSIDLRVLAHRAADDQWDFDTVVAVLDHQEKSSHTRSDLPVCNDLLAVHERWPIERLPELLTSISKSELTINGQAIRIARYDGQKWGPIYAQFPGLWSRQASRLGFGIDFASFVMRVWEGIQPATLKRNDLGRVINGELRAFDPPWDGIADLRRNFVGVQGTWAEGLEITAATLDVVAPLGVRIRYPVASIDEHLTSLGIEEFSSALEQRTRISLIGRKDDGSFLRQRLEPKRIEGALEMRMDSRNLPSRTTVILTYGGVEVDRTDLFSPPNPPLAVFQGFIPNWEESWEKLPSRLIAASSNSLESWFTILLQLLGLAPAHYGGTSLEAPDIVAFPQAENWVLVAECTKREPDVGNKLSKLATRSKEINQLLEGFTVIPVIVTTLSRTIINRTDLEKAKKEGISVLTADEFQALFDLAVEEASATKLRDFVIGLIPAM